MPKVDPFIAAVAKAAKLTVKQKAEIQAGLLALVTKRQSKPVPFKKLVGTVDMRTGKFTPVKTGKAERRSARRIGRVKAYTPTTKPDYSRPGTFRHYMIKTIREHSDTLSANNAHAVCTEPSYAKNRLDFNWAADNGYINWA